MSSTNFGPIFIFASCVVGTVLVIYYMDAFFIGRGPIFLCHSCAQTCILLQILVVGLASVSDTRYDRGCINLSPTLKIFLV